MAKSGFAILWLATLALLSACQSGPPAAVPTASASAPAAVPARPAAPATNAYQTTGPLVVENQVDVTAQRTGVVAKVLADVGTPVHKGELLAQLDDRQLVADHEAAVAKALSVEQDAKNWETEIKLVDNDLARDEELYKNQLITLQQLEHSRFKAEGARQQREREVQSTREAKAKAQALQLELDKTKIIAPFDGVVARRYVRMGQQVAPNDRLFWVTATAPLNVRFTLPQEMVAKVKPGEVVTVAAGNDGPEHQAKVTLVSPVVDPSSSTFDVQAQVLGAPGELRPGMTVNIRVKTQ